MNIEIGQESKWSQFTKTLSSIYLCALGVTTECFFTAITQELTPQIDDPWLWGTKIIVLILLSKMISMSQVKVPPEWLTGTIAVMTRK